MQIPKITREYTIADKNKIFIINELKTVKKKFYSENVSEKEDAKICFTTITKRLIVKF